MGLIQKIKDARTKAVNKSIAVQSETNYRVSPLASNYENLFAQVRPLVDEMKQVRPFGVGQNGARLDLSKTPELAALDYPNDKMGFAEFADLMFATWLTEEELAIRVHRDSRGRVYGYTIIPAGHKFETAGGYVYYSYIEADGSQANISRDEVMTLRFSRSPRDPGHGVSPAMSVQVQAQVEDLLWQYERAFFENGARPESICIIKASTKEGFDKKRYELERDLKGANNRNKTLYLWRQYLSDGSMADEVEVKTIQGNNSTLALREISEILQDSLNKSIGVSNFLLGDDSSAKYDNAELSDHVFTKRRVFPALIMFWSEFQHELDRILGGLGYGIMFELELPELTDRLKTKAETASINANTVISLIGAGAKPSAVVNALGLGEKWQGVADSLYHDKVSKEELAAAINSTAESQEPARSEVQASKDAVRKEPVKTADVEFSGSNYEPKWNLPEEENVKTIYDLLMRCAEAEAAEDKTFDLEKAKIDINKALAQAAEDGALDGAEFMQKLAVGSEASAGLKKVLTDGYTPSEDAVKAMEERTESLLERFDEDARAKFIEVREQAKETGLTKKELEGELMKVMPYKRAETIARTETHAAMNSGRIDLDKQFAERYGIKLELVWTAHIDDRTCPVCAAMDGETVALGEAFPEHVFADIDGVRTQVDFEHTEFNLGGQAPDAHPRCRCTFNERVVR